MPCALFFDVDGTLVDWAVGVERIPRTALAEFARIQAMGHKLFVCSGRPQPMIDERITEGGFDGYVLNNGGFVEIDGQSIYQERLEPELAHQAAELLDAWGIHYAIDTAHHVFVDPARPKMGEFLGNHGDIITYDFDRDHVLERTIKFECMPPDELRDGLMAAVKGAMGDRIRCDNNGTGMTFELFSPSISKATGIRHALAYVGIAAEDSYGFGDGLNDMEMIELCGTGVAMGNACPELKAAADIVCDSVADDGLAKVLRELF